MHETFSISNNKLKKKIEKIGIVYGTEKKITLI